MFHQGTQKGLKPGLRNAKTLGSKGLSLKGRCSVANATRLFYRAPTTNGFWLNAVWTTRGLCGRFRCFGGATNAGYAGLTTKFVRTRSPTVTAFTDAYTNRDICCYLRRTFGVCCWFAFDFGVGVGSVAVRGGRCFHAFCRIGSRTRWTRGGSLGGFPSDFCGVRSGGGSGGSFGRFGGLLRIWFG